jgi:hypothetical protein
MNQPADTSVKGVSLLGESVSPQTSSLTFHADAPRAITYPHTFDTSSARTQQSEQVGTETLPNAIKANWGKIIKAQLSERIYVKLESLAAGPSSMLGPNAARPLDAKSLGDFLDFWVRVRTIAAEPEITSAPDGTLHAEWYKSDRQRLDARFTANGVMFGLIAGTKLIEGAETPETVASLLKNNPAQPLKWTWNGR